jgi:hypothetical protein
LPITAIECPKGQFEQQEASHRVILPCSWRTLKESASFISRIVNVNCGFVSRETCVVIGDELMFVLRSVKHRAVLEQVYTSLRSVCADFWTRNDPLWANQPMIWLNNWLDALNVGETEGLCATRRAAGLHFIILSLVCTEPPVNNFSGLSKAMTSLIKLGTDSNHPSAVIAFNIIRSLFTDAALSEGVAPFVDEGLVVAVNTFYSDSWDVRNCGNLLFANLIARIFGVKRDKNKVSTRNTMTVSLNGSRKHI